MIDGALTFLVDELTDYLRASYSTTEAKAVLSAHSSLDASPAAEILNKVIVTLVKLEPESTLRKVSADGMSTVSEFLRSNPAIKLNLLVLFAANFTDYTESLDFMTAVLTFFQGRNVFTPQNSPRLAPTFERLVLELVSTSCQDWRFLWGMLGAHHTLGAVYRLRMITAQESTPAIQAVPINR